MYIEKEREWEGGRVLARRRRFDERPSRDARGEKEGENGSGEWHGAGCLGTERNLGGEREGREDLDGDGDEDGDEDGERERAAKKRVRERSAATGERRRQ